MIQINRTIGSTNRQRKSRIRVCLLVCCALAITAWINAGHSQNFDERLEAIISGVRANVVSGGMFFERDKARFELTPGLELNDGDLLISERGGRAELLLQPGNYLRLNSETRLKVLSTQYDRVRLQLDTGSISFELLKTEAPRYFEADMLFLIRVVTPHAEVIVSQSGITRISVDSSGNTEVAVRKGEAILNGTRVKEKKIARQMTSVISTSEFNSKSEDDFDLWCRERAGELVQLNKSLKKEAPWSNRKDAEPVIDVPSDDDGADSPYVVSAKPGKVTFAETGSEVMRPQKEWADLTVSTDLQSHDRLRTDANSRVELMMFPDIYFRLDGNSEVVFEELSNDAVSITLVRGAAILDAAIFDRKKLPPFRIGVPATSAIIAADGNYRWDINATFAQVSVREGKVVLLGNTIDGCLRYSNGVSARCENKRTDNFDTWSWFRGEGIFFNGRPMAGRLARLRARWLKNTGFWYRPSPNGYYTFVPYSSSSFQSPYGGNYSVALSPRRAPTYQPSPANTRGGVVPGTRVPPDRN